VRTAGPIFKMSDSPTASEHSSPRLGEHTLEVLAALGYDANEIETLLESGAVSGIVSPNSGA
jgi:crotonobetainyl-CoA:carnitine CoA-transferase CaiB-like acyl-CoA transferase